MSFGKHIQTAVGCTLRVMNVWNGKILVIWGVGRVKLEQRKWEEGRKTGGGLREECPF